MPKRLLQCAASGLVIALIAISALYVRDMNRAYERVQDKSTVIASPYGDIEYVEGGSGPAVLLVHGSGGGFDQGELIARAVLGDEFRWIAPSRFGYLRSSFQEGATWDAQADAYAFLLDHLNIENVAVVAMSQGGPSALLFAVLHPERVSSLTLISCGVVASSAGLQAQANEKGEMLTTIFRYDPLYWLISRSFRKQLMILMGADDAVIAGLTSDQRILFDEFIDYMNPVSLRSSGAEFDNKALLPGKRIAAIMAPTLILHAADDTLQLFHNAEFAAATIPDSTLVRFAKGGHFLIGTEETTVRNSVRDHIHGRSGRSPSRIPDDEEARP
ncbi:MAG: alpha/beta hydrolase [Gammaproteobacteria bacterium]|nr:alpha/beta hydrolase [Gammaproteobacteria bacterium]MDH4313995.1 alpha/beta hydrolase [Gammaproteobacteria bacterium]MDH5212729.1 alpha/beta hydrolase [Gammaproteobacteria bacterium]MDH5500127.1 alpha/beta hydrolase [Gammaproteobacteria bacterium]